jgi:hypothetical protein
MLTAMMFIVMQYQAGCLQRSDGRFYCDDQKSATDIQQRFDRYIERSAQADDCPPRCFNLTEEQRRHFREELGIAEQERPEVVSLQRVQSQMVQYNTVMCPLNANCKMMEDGSIWETWPEQKMLSPATPKPCVTLEVSRPEPKWVLLPCPGCAALPRLPAYGPENSYGKWTCPHGWKVESSEERTVDWGMPVGAWCMEPGETQIHYHNNAPLEGPR